MPVPMKVWRVQGVNGSMPTIRRLAEKATQTFKAGTPVLVEAATGFLIERTVIDDAVKVVAGVALEAGGNLTTSGVAKTTTEGSVVNQTNAVVIPAGVKPSDGKNGVLLALDAVEFAVKLKAGTNFAVTDVGLIYGLIKNADGFWEVDKTITTAAAGACVEVTETIDAAGTDAGLIAVRFTRARQQLQT